MMKRLKGITIQRPLVYGTLAFWQGKGAEQDKQFKSVNFVSIEQKMTTEFEIFFFFKMDCLCKRFRK